ncbi:hypothetical protein EOM89_13830, partial [Candidatus Falkowbacteria bacterium]|nr:hypothetical protein [Candidatus Falkowbacteria bacterium]
MRPIACIPRVAPALCPRNPDPGPPRMIVVFIHELNRNPLLKMLASAKGRLPPITPVTYQQAFRRLAFPAGTLIFTDFEFLDGFGMMAAAAMADAALRRDPQTRVLNHPADAAERYALLRRLHRAGLNPVEVTRLDGGDRPTRYPVFLRLEDGCLGAETGLLHTAEDFDAALAHLRATQRPLKRRIAVSFEASADAEGGFRKYGAFRIGDAIILGQNIDFDLSFFHRYGFFKDNPTIDTYELAAVLMPTASRYGLGSLARQLGVVLTNAHRALDDAKATMQVYQQLNEKIADLPVDLVAEIR